ncbi:Alkaline phosphatase synthesis sensor protein PhoR [Polaribacter huanghezhanensis]|uniref:sensor histidine kinase n=1 Tax=Polaribacter huanghezhanensis TaxID=1354726 RepID=UPI002647D2D5|nr:ATP-binding protein [Polaribacter huanghezhanensis]WKD85561.1 Alkaline phosphatase synthesis sensor protein PhoR [Polaribacter huanghezhanensis]
MKLKKTYSFAIITAVYLAILVIVINVLAYFLYQKLGFWILPSSIITLLIISFFIIQYRVEYFIYRRVRKIYEDVSLLEIEDLKRKSVTTDMETLSKSLQRFAEGKRIEIQNLTERDSFRRDFLGNVAHELKTPLFTVQGYLLTLIEGASKDKEILEKYLKRANKGVERLAAIVKDLDMIAKLETEGLKIDLQPFNILELVQNVFDLFEMRAKKKNISLVFDRVYEFPIYVIGDVQKIEQVLINLVVNSIKYGKIGGLTKVAVDDYNENKFIIKVSDNGEGVKQEHISRLFERFYRVDQSRSRDQGGSGLGLAIVKHIIEAHNQTILLKSTFKEGSEFSFSLEKAK